MLVHQRVVDVIMKAKLCNVFLPSTNIPAGGPVSQQGIWSATVIVHLNRCVKANQDVKA